jgi:hypothetical protein
VPEIAEGWEALRRQTAFDVQLLVSDELRPFVSAAAIETAVTSQLRRAGITATRWVARETVRPALVLSLDGVPVQDHVVYAVSLEYYSLLQIPGMPPERLIKGGVYRTGFDGIAPARTSANALADAVSRSIDGFLTDAYFKANPSPQPASPLPAGGQMVLDSREAMQGYAAGPRAVALVVTLDKDIPIAESDVRGAGERVLRQHGLDVVPKGRPDRPLVAVTISGLRTSAGGFVYAVLVQYRRLLNLPEPGGGGTRPVVAGFGPLRTVGTGALDFVVSNVRSSVEEAVGRVIQPHVEANKTIPLPGPEAGALVCTDPDIGFMRVPRNVVDQVLKFGSITARDVVYDIGWGDGAVANAAARSGSRATAFPLCPLGYVVAARNAASSGVARPMAVGTDFYAADLSDATVVVLHMLPILNQKLLSKLTRELKPGTRVISIVFNMGDCHPPDRTIVLEGAPRLFATLNSWTMPMKNTCVPGSAQ